MSSEIIKDEETKKEEEHTQNDEKIEKTCEENREKEICESKTETPDEEREEIKGTESSKSSQEQPSDTEGKRHNDAKDVLGATTDLSRNITTIDDKEIALYAHNVVRKLHGVAPMKWDEELAEKAKAWAITCVERDVLEHSEYPLTHGENIYYSTGTSSSARTYQAVFAWYKSFVTYSWKSPAFDFNSGTFTQIIWDTSTKLGVGVAFCEDTHSTYIVANYMEPGNVRSHVRNTFAQHVKPPLAGLPPRMPKLQELISPNVSGLESDPIENLSNMKTLVDVLCHWCINTGEKPVEKLSATHRDEKLSATHRDEKLSATHRDEKGLEGNGKEATKETKTKVHTVEDTKKEEEITEKAVEVKAETKETKTSEQKEENEEAKTVNGNNEKKEVKSDEAKN